MKKGVRIALWVTAGFFLLLFFTFLKFPDDRLKPLIQNQIDTALAPLGIRLAAERSSLGIFFGLSYTLENVTLSSPNLAKPVTVDRIRIAPALIGSLMGQVQARITAKQGKGSARIDLFMPTPQESGDFEVEAKLEDLDLTALPLVKLAANVHVGGVASGQLSASGNAEIPSSLEGSTDLKIQKLQFDQQSVMGFPLPKLSAPQAQVRINVAKGKLQIEQLQIDKGGELWANVTGQSTLGQTWDASSLDFKAQFGITDAVLQTLSFVEALIRGAKQADGSYAFTIAGTFGAPFVNPVIAQ